MCEDAPREVLRLDQFGVPFARTRAGALALRQLNGSHTARAVFAADFTGHVVLHTLYEQLLKAAIPTYAEWQVLSLIIEAGQCQGVLALEQRTGNIVAFGSRAVILATGGAGRIYQRSTASRSGTGDGLSLAYRAGLRLVDMEIVPYHPLGFRAHRASASEATLAAGAVLGTRAGEPLLRSNGPQLRDTLCRSMAQSQKDSQNDGYFLLDMRLVSKDVLASQFQYLQRVANEKKATSRHAMMTMTACYSKISHSGTSAAE